MQISGLKIDTIGGFCPVQAEGALDGMPFYFRARGQHWSFSVGAEPVGKPDWIHREAYGEGPFDAGYMLEEEALSFIAKAVGLYREIPEPTGA